MKTAATTTTKSTATKTDGKNRPASKATSVPPRTSCCYSVCFVFKVNGVFSGHTALQAASQNGHMDVVKILISMNANLEIEVCLLFCLITVLVLTSNFFQALYTAMSDCY